MPDWVRRTQGASEALGIPASVNNSNDSTDSSSSSTTTTTNNNNDKYFSKQSAVVYFDAEVSARNILRALSSLRCPRVIGPILDD